MEQGGVLTDEVVDLDGFALGDNLIRTDRVVAEEGVLVVNDVELEELSAAVHSDADVALLDETEVAQLAYGIGDAAGIVDHDAVHPGAESGIVRAVRSADGRSLRDPHVGDEDADVDARWCQAADSDLVERFLKGSVESFAGESGEVDGDVAAGESLLDVGAESRRPFGAIADEDAAALAGHDKAFILQVAQGALDRCPREAVVLGQHLVGGQLLPRGQLLRSDGCAKAARDLLVGRAVVVRVQGLKGERHGSMLRRT